MFESSEGGLATGLSSVYQQGQNLWIGWPGIYLKEDEEKQQVVRALDAENMRPVFLSDTEIREFYEGFSNETLWPVFHYFNQYAVYEQQFWETYVQVNQKFCDEIIAIAAPGDTIWIHDYQLLLLPGMVRQKLPEISIGFFQHIPFPSFEIFRLLPWRRQLLEGILGADLVGFHTYDDMRHFLSSVNRIVGLPSYQGQIEIDNRSVIVDAFPMGIDYDKYATIATSEAVEAQIKKYRPVLKAEKIILSIDRLDYSKGIPQRLKAFELFLKKHREFHEKVVLVMQVIPSRDEVEKYKELKEEVDELVGRINSTYRTIGWSPIQYFYRSFPLEILSALYRMADVALVTPMRDGMNLVCKEYVASRIDKKGVLILSEMAGASRELSDAILINPNDIHAMVEALHTALTMPEAEQIKHMELMQQMIKRYNVHHWVQLFMNRLVYARKKQKVLATKKLDREAAENIRARYLQASSRLIFLDYDGTLTAFRNEPDAATPDNELIELLRRLADDSENRVVIISGRSRYTLEQWLGALPVDIIAEHGVWLKEYGQEWRIITALNNDWKNAIRPVMESHVNRTPGSLIEEKDYSLVWHYRRVETGLGEMRARELLSHLSYLISNTQLQVMEGSKVVEVKNLEVNKGTAAVQWLERYPAECIIAIGDDRTDEDVFLVMPENAITVKVGSKRSRAKYHTPSHITVRSLLNSLLYNSENTSVAAKIEDGYYFSMEKHNGGLLDTVKRAKE